MAMLDLVCRKIESRLYHAGFASAIVRRFLCVQSMLCVASFVAGLALLPLTAWPLSFSAGACIAGCSLWGIARFAQAGIGQQYSALLCLKLFLSFSGRFLLIGVALFILIVLLRTPVIPLVIGLSSTVASIAAWGISRYTRKTAKEA